MRAAPGSANSPSSPPAASTAPPEVARFLLDPAPALASLSRTLADGSYRPREGRAFWILDPKPRVIFALPALERGFAPQRYGCRTGKGSHACLRRAVELFLPLGSASGRRISTQRRRARQDAKRQEEMRMGS